MSKVICDICGTIYPESSEKCPVCGCSRDFGLDDYEEELLMGASDAFQSPKKKSREIFIFIGLKTVQNTNNLFHVISWTG